MSEPDLEAQIPDHDTLAAADPNSIGAAIRRWFVVEGAWWTASFGVHMVLMCALMLVGMKVVTKDMGDALSLESANEQAEKPDGAPEKLETFDLGKAPLDPTELNTDTLQLNQAPQIETSGTVDEGGASGIAEGGGRPMAATGPMLGGLGGFDIHAIGPGPAVRGRGGVGVGVGTGNNPGAGGSGYGFGGRGGSKKGLVGGFGGTKGSERAVAAALSWLAHHQNPNGSWSLESYSRRCKDATCTGAGASKADSAATALSLLPFLAAGQTHESRGPYKQVIYSGLYWLLSNQKKDGDLRCGNTMYAHGLATITLCEAYGLTGDKMLGQHAQSAVNFIVAAQNTQTGGWRYEPGDPGDTSVVGWQVMALKSAQMAYLNVDPKAFEGIKRWLESVGTGPYKSLCAYTPGGGAGSPAMVAAGLLCHEYMHVARGDPLMLEGTKWLMAHLPSNAQRNCYYWYYATQVMHNVPGTDWDTWNRQMRRVLIESQCKDGCAMGSWDPASPGKDAWGAQGGRVYMTSLAALTLEVYYRYLPLYKLDAEGGSRPPGGGIGAPAPEAASPKAVPPKAEEKKPAGKTAPAPVKPKPAAAADKGQAPEKKPALKK